MDALRKEEHYTYNDYSSWDDGIRYELIDGAVYAMSPAPSSAHQGVSMALSIQLGSYLKGKPCKVFAAPFDVRLNADTFDDTVVQPDIVVICDQEKLSGTGCTGAPDLVIEITSPSTARNDRLIKFNLYQQYGVREYWIVDPDTKSVTVHILESGKYITSAYADTDSVAVHVLDGCTIDLTEVFER